MNCIFCKIVKGEIPAHKVYEDSEILVFLDIQPVSKGHCLVIPKKHVSDFYELDDRTYTHLFGVVKGLSEEIKDAFDPKKIGVMIQGFEVDHAHVHVFPLDSPDQFKIDKSMSEKLGHRIELLDTLEKLSEE